MLLSLLLPTAAALLSLVYLGSETAVIIVSLLLLFLLLSWALLRVWIKKRVAPTVKGTIGVFHPAANGGGGGERVLWCAIEALQQAFPDCKIVLYCESGHSAADLTTFARSRFNLDVKPDFQVLGLANAHLLDPALYPRFTLIRQSLAAVFVAFSALQQFVPEVFLDTAGWAFAYPLVRLVGPKVACYVHYPTISTDMLQRVQTQQATYNNEVDVSQSYLKTLVKILYYHAFAALYGLVGACASVVMVNSTWTLEHINQLWWLADEPKIVYPPCDIKALQELPLDRKLKRLYLVSIAQFRPEKNHKLQLEAYAAARKSAENNHCLESEAVLASRLVVIGSCRHADDEARLKELQDLSDSLGVAEYVDWHVGVDFAELRSMLGSAVGGLHSMVDEHFGISIVEYMAAGVVPIVHNSGGPKMDIVVHREFGGTLQRTGYTCSTLQEYVDAITDVLAASQLDRMKIAAAARRHASQFSDECFKQHFLQALLPVLPRHLTSNVPNFQ